MPSTPLTCSSIGAATVSRTVVGVGPGIDGRHLHGRRRHVGILRDRQREHGHAARQHDDERDHRGEDRADRRRSVQSRLLSSVQGVRGDAIGR